MQVPEVRLFAAGDDANQTFYAVIKGPRGWYGMPGLRKGQFLSDEDVKDAIPLQPGPSAVVDISFDDSKPFGDDSLCDVDVNGHAGTRKASVFVAGAFIVATAIQKGEPIMVRTAPKKTATPLTEVTEKRPARALSVVRNPRS